MRGFREIDDLDHVDQLVELFGDLLEHFFGARGNNGHAREGCILGRRDGQGFDVVAASGKEAGYTRQGAGFVLDQDGNDVTHFRSPRLQVFGQDHVGQALAGRHHREDIGFRLVWKSMKTNSSLWSMKAFLSAGPHLRPSTRMPTWP